MRIISLVPSITELLFDLELGAHIVGRTKFCIHPAGQVSEVPKVGGTKNVNVDRVLSLEPTHIIANKEENTKDQINQLQSQSNVLVTDIKTCTQAIDAIRTIGDFTDTRMAAQAMAAKIEKTFADLHPLPTRKKVCYLIWRNPYMTVGSDTYIHDMLSRCGLDNIYNTAMRYPTVDISDLAARQPDLIFLSSEPYPFKNEHIQEIQDALPHAHIMLVDGEYFSWYGSRMIAAAGYFASLISILGDSTR